MQKLFAASLFLCQFDSGSAVAPEIMTGNHQATPSAPDVPTTPAPLPDAASTPDGKQSGDHNPKKFMSELHSIHSRLIFHSLDLETVCYAAPVKHFRWPSKYAWKIILYSECVGVCHVALQCHRGPLLPSASWVCVWRYRVLCAFGRSV